MAIDRLWLIIVVAAFAISVPGDALAQRGQTSAITGVVRDATGAVVQGVHLVAASDRLIGGPLTVATTEIGLYRFLELPPGEYSFRVTHPGFKTMTRGGISVSPGGAVALDWNLEIASAAEVLDVAAPSPVVDVRSAASPTRLTRTLLDTLPLTRSISALVSLTPGVVNDAPFGASARSIAVTFDGSPGTRPSGGEPLVYPVYHAIDEIQVTALGAGAEHRDSTGVQANVVSRSGSNSLAGLGEYRVRRPHWVGNNRHTLPEQLRERFRPQELLSDWDLAAFVGGPVRRDRLWYFGAFQKIVDDKRPSGWMNVPRSPDEAVSSLDDRRTVGKITATLSPALRLEAFYQHNSQQLDAFNAGPLISPEALGMIDDVQRVWNARLLWIPGPSTFVTLLHGGYRQRYYEGPTTPASAAGPPPRYDQVTFVTSGAYVWFTDSRLRPLTTSSTVTHVVDGFLGLGHELKAGLDYERNRSEESWGYPGGHWFTDAGGVPQTVDILPASFVRPLQRRFSAFVQDRWQLSDRVTLEPGLRLVFNRGQVRDRGTVYATNPVAPRIGLAWDVTSSHRTVLRAHYGRYHDSLLDNAYSFMDPLGSPVYTFATVTGANSYQVISTSGGPTNQAIDPNLTQSFVDAYLVGVEHELFDRLSLRAQYIRRSFKNFMAFIDPESVYVPVVRVDPGPDGRLQTSDDAGPITVFDRQNVAATPRMLTNADDAYRHYQAVQLIGTKRYADNWELQGSYTWSRARGNVNNLWGTNAASNGLGANGQFADPNRLINADGVPTHDYPHQVTLLGVVRLPWWHGLNVGTVYRYTSGRAWGRTVRFTGLRQGATTVRVEPIGTYRMPATSQLDLRLEKTWRPRGHQQLGVFGEVLNLNNQGTSQFVNEGSAASFGLPGSWTLPRSLRLGGRVTF